MRFGVIIATVALLGSCRPSEDDGEHSKTPSESVIDSDSPALWFAEWEAQRNRFGGEPPSPQEIRETGRRVFILEAERAADTKRRMYRLRAFDAIDGSRHLYESFEGVLERLAAWDDRAAIYYAPPDTGSPPAFTFREFNEIRREFEAKGYELILHGS